jgi:hypothetical protein
LLLFDLKIILRSRVFIPNSKTLTGFCWLYLKGYGST